MAIPEIDSFVLKLKNLLLAGINANLTINSKAGKASLPLAAEVDVRVPHPHHASAARLRRRVVNEEQQNEQQQLLILQVLKLLIKLKKPMPINLLK